MAEKLLTIEELAVLVRTSPAALHTLRYRLGEPKGVRVGRRVLFRESDVTAWLESRAEQPEGDRVA